MRKCGHTMVIGIRLIVTLEHEREQVFVRNSKGGKCRSCRHFYCLCFRPCYSDNECLRNENKGGELWLCVQPTRSPSFLGPRLDYRRLYPHVTNYHAMHGPYRARVIISRDACHWLFYSAENRFCSESSTRLCRAIRWSALFTGTAKALECTFARRVCVF